MILWQVGNKKGDRAIYVVLLTGSITGFAWRRRLAKFEIEDDTDKGEVKKVLWNG